MKYTNRGLRRRRNTNKWEAVLSYCDPVTQEIETRYYTVEGKNETEAKRARDELKLKLESEVEVSSDKSVAEYIDFHVKRISSSVEKSTARDYRKDSKRVSLYPIAAKRVSQVTIKDIDEWIKSMENDGYEPRTIQKSFRVVKATLKTAMAEGDIAKNPCDFVKPPRVRRKPVKVLTKEQRDLLLKVSQECPDNRIGLIIETDLATGLRRGEACALKWADLSEDRIIHVNEAVGEGDDGWYLKAVKNEEDRFIPVIRHTYDRLMIYKEKRVFEAEKLHIPLNSFIFGLPGKKNSFCNPDAMGKEVSAIAKLCGIDCSMHDLRHTFATILVAQGVDIATVASYLGDSIEVTLKYYSTCDPNAKLAALPSIERGLGLETII